MDWIEFKFWIERVVGLDKDALHIYAACIIQIAAALLLRRSLAAKLPWLAVLAAVLINEWLDLHVEIWPDRWEQYRASIHDILNTMLLPTVLVLLVRYVPQLTHRQLDTDLTPVRTAKSFGR